MERSEMKQKEYIKAKGIWYANEIKTIKKIILMHYILFMKRLPMLGRPF